MTKVKVPYPLHHYVEMVLNPGYVAQYRDCDINELNKISDEHWLLTLQIPLPMGGELQVIAHRDEKINIIYE